MRTFSPTDSALRHPRMNYSDRPSLAARLTGVFIALLVPLATAPVSLATTLYWDTNGATAGSGAANGTWGVDTFWTTDSTGSSAPSVITTTTADDLFIAAGTNGTTG